ncbi:hypothetical protein DLJ46_26950 [Micromonospora globispora]|uniref:Uncharacterized protein n=1 Tax=Micromonospora globispora TaxID=1450148 RepID=A0A317JUG2_9ACTN|nr:hypothetical protein [Micromonospora globispora]PWU44265.1 hypothetical protein DLJ46_26950 [Micromonospora globispora]
MSPDTALIGGLVLVTVLAIGAMLWIVLGSGPESESTAKLAIPAIGTLAASSVGGIVKVLRNRRGRSRRS